jgi:hypothetical protein
MLLVIVEIVAIVPIWRASATTGVLVPLAPTLAIVNTFSYLYLFIPFAAILVKPAMLFTLPLFDSLAHYLLIFDLEIVLLLPLVMTCSSLWMILNPIAFGFVLFIFNRIRSIHAAAHALPCC